ncbi:MAG TPA: TfoX/Sxy family protein [Cellvibrio sp.]|nr:TfoX/Sxy family protein [Cellvibrio sp.]
MNLSHAYLDRVIANLSRVTEVSYRRLFNGVGIYHCGVQFAFVINDRLYVRADEYSRPLFLERGMLPFQPRIAVQVESCFFQLSELILQSPSELKHWIRIAIEASHAGDFLDDETTVDTPIHHMRQRA